SPAVPTRCSETSWPSESWASRASSARIVTWHSATSARPPPNVAGQMDIDDGTLTASQAARRDRVIRTALELGAKGGYDAVQMRAVAASAGVALGTIYRYFSSKDHLLAAAMVEWVHDLERRVGQKPPKGDTAADRVRDVLSRAT